MVINLGALACERKAIDACFGSSYRMRRSVRILDMDHNLVSDVTDLFLDGQVDVRPGDSQASRTASVSLFDPRRQVGFDQANPARGIVSPKYLLALSRGMYVDALDDWCDIDVGRLWLTKPSRTGDILTLEAQGKESLARYPAERQITFSATTKKTSAIRTILESVGEQRFRIESSSAKLGKTFTLDVGKSPWEACQSIAKSMGWQLFYDAQGYVVCRPKPSAAVFTFRCGDGGTMRSDPEFSYTDGTIYNKVRATGGTPTGKNAPIVKTRRVDSHSPLYVTRGGQFVPMIYEASNDKLLTASDVQDFADDTLAQVILDSQTATWDSSPVWHLEEGDPVRLTDAIDDRGNGATFSETVRVGSMSIPLTLGSQSNGYTRRVSRSTSRIRRRAA